MDTLGLVAGVWLYNENKTEQNKMEKFILKGEVKKG
jgi:hypothetical protein